MPPIFEDYSINGELLQTRQEYLDEANLARYIQVKGLNETEGYIDCLEHTLISLDGVLYVYSKDRTKRGMNSDSVIRAELIEINDKKLAFSTSVRKILTKPGRQGATTLRVSPELTKISQQYEIGIDQYVTESGIAKAKGFLACLEDDVTTLDGILYTYSKNKTACHLNGGSFVRKQIEKFYDQKMTFFEYAKEFIGKIKSYDDIKL